MQKLKSFELEITGMSCASCSAKIEKELNKINGVKAAVNFASGRAKIELDTEMAIADVKKTIEKLGYKPQEIEERRSEDNREYVKLKFRVIISCALSLPFIAEMIMHWAGTPVIFLSNVYFQLALASIIQFYIGCSFYKKAFAALLSFYADMNVLIAISTSAAYFASIYSMFWDQHHLHLVYFESSSLIITLVVLGKFIECKTAKQSFDAVRKLLRLQPDSATIIIELNGSYTEKTIPAKDIKKGDLILVKPGERIPVDGEVIDGFTDIDESLLTGESIPSIKEKGSRVYTGTINLSGSIKFKARKTGKETTLAKIIKLVSDAQNSKAPIQKIADRISLYFVPAIIIISLITLILWWTIEGDWIKGLINAIAVLIIACPCSLGLATPTALMAGIGLGAKSGIFIKNAEAIQNIGKIDTIVFDKTGTLTQGKLNVVKVIAHGISETELLVLAAQAEKNSGHHIGNAIFEFAKEFLKQNITDPKEIKNFPGKGVEVIVDKGILLVGAESFLNGKEVKALISEEGRKKLKGSTLVFAALNGRYIGVIGLKDNPKKETAGVIAKLKEMKYSIHMLTGDNRFAAEDIGSTIGIENIKSEVLPDEKEIYLKKLKEGGSRVLMTGDGINDAPALTSADIGIAMGTGSDIAIETGDIIISGGNLELIVKAIRISKTIFRTIKQNLFWAFIYNIVAIPFAALGFLNPIIAAAAMSLSSMSVVFNSFLITCRGKTPSSPE